MSQIHCHFPFGLATVATWKADSSVLYILEHQIDRVHVDDATALHVTRAECESLSSLSHAQRSQPQRLEVFHKIVRLRDSLFRLDRKSVV